MRAALRLPRKPRATAFTAVVAQACAATFGFMLICVVVSQQLLYRLGDGTYGSRRFGTDDAPDARDSALGRWAAPPPPAAP